MIELELNKICIDEERQEQVIVFREKQGERYLPVVIGLAEVQAIELKVKDVETPRPMTHDLLNNVIHDLGAEVKYVVIDRIEGNTFFARILLKKENGEELSVDSRPSDSVALAVRSGSLIYAQEAVFEQANLN